MIAPGKRHRDDDDDADADEFFADVLASAAVAGVIKGVNNRLRRRNPPERAKPHPTTSGWAAEGLSYRLEQLMGRSALGPNAKIALGFGGMIVTMMMNAEPIPVHERTAPPPPSTHAQTNGHAHTDDGRPAQTALVVPSAMREDAPTAAAPPPRVADASASAVGTFKGAGN